MKASGAGSLPYRIGYMVAFAPRCRGLGGPSCQPR